MVIDVGHYKAHTGIETKKYFSVGKSRHKVMKCDAFCLPL